MSELAPYDDDEEIQLMDTDGTSLQLDEQIIETDKNVVEKKQDNIEEKREKIPSLLVIEKLKVYLREGPNVHRVETITVEDKYYDLPNNEQLTSIELTEEKYDELLESLNLKREDFRSSINPTGLSRPESLYIRGVNNMSTQEILNYFEDFQPNGIEWISDQSCNLFWNETLSPLKLIQMKTNPGPKIAHRQSDNYDQTIRSGKRKASAMLNENENQSVDVALPPGHWREGTFQAFDKPELTAKFYLRYSTLDDRKRRGAENQSEYYRQYGNPNYNNMTGLISRSKKRALNAKRFNRFQDFTVVKSKDDSSTDLVEEIPLTTTEENSTDPKVKFTVVLPPKKTSPNRNQQDDDDNDDNDDGHRSKRQRRGRSRESDDEDKDDDRHRQRRRDKTHFTVTLDAATKRSQDSKARYNHSSRDDDDDDDGDNSTPVTDARQILERKRRNRK